MRWLTIFALLATTGCEGLLDGDDGGVRAMDAGPPAQVAGRWELSGSGRLKRCDDDRFNTDDLSINATLTIGQMGTELTLAGMRPVPGGRFVFDEATVLGPRVQFSTLEESGGNRIVLRFEGFYDALVDNIAGRFEGDGPGTCEASGRFTVEIGR